MTVLDSKSIKQSPSATPLQIYGGAPLSTRAPSKNWVHFPDTDFSDFKNHFSGYAVTRPLTRNNLQLGHCQKAGHRGTREQEISIGPPDLSKSHLSNGHKNDRYSYVLYLNCGRALFRQDRIHVMYFLWNLVRLCSPERNPIL